MFCQDTKLLAPKGRNSIGRGAGAPPPQRELALCPVRFTAPAPLPQDRTDPSALGTPAREVRLHPTEQPRKIGAVSSYHAKSRDGALARTAKGEVRPRRPSGGTPPTSV